MPGEKISPALIVLPALGLGLLGVLAIAALAWAAPEEPEPEPEEPEPEPEEPEPEPEEPVVTVALKNPPSGANRWGFTLYDWSGTKSLARTVYSVDGVATFNIPPDWAFPLRFWIQVIYYSSVTVLHQAQSLSPAWPNYIVEFIPEYGNYYYNVATGQFEPMGVAKTLELQAAP